MGLEEFVDDKTSDKEESSSNPFLESVEVETRGDRVVTANLSLSRLYENATDEEAVERHKEWVYEMARAIEEDNSKVKLTDWTALEHRVREPSDSDVENFYSE